MTGIASRIISEPFDDEQVDRRDQTGLPANCNVCRLSSVVREDSRFRQNLRGGCMCRGREGTELQQEQEGGHVSRGGDSG